MPENQEIAWAYWRLIGEGRIDEALERLNDAGTFWMNRTREAVPMAAMKRVSREMLKSIPGVQFTLHNSFEQGDQVLLELESHTVLSDGQPYNNVYCVVVTVSADTLLHVREYGDTRHGERALSTEKIEGLIDEQIRR